MLSPWYDVRVVPSSHADRGALPMKLSSLIPCVALCTFLSSPADAAEPPVREGVVRFEAVENEPSVPERFRLPAHTFAFQQQWLNEVSDHLTVSMVTFPSPVTTPHELNNTVHCEYYCPTREGKVPAVIVLHILGGDFPLARVFCNALAQRGVAAMLVKMPYYGPRQQPGVERRMISKDARETVEGMTQAILDIRRAVAWLAAQENVDAEQLGVFGISLGGITGALALTAEPKLHNACLLLAGGDIGRVGWESPKLVDTRRRWLEQGGTKEEYFELLKSIDPVTYAANARGRRILMLNAKEDEVIPHSCTESLWKSFGEPDIVWYDGGHYSVARHILNALFRVTRFFEPTAMP
jgi:dienelactone hydrolase